MVVVAGIGSRSAVCSAALTVKGGMAEHVVGACSLVSALGDYSCCQS